MLERIIPSFLETDEIAAATACQTEHDRLSTVIIKTEGIRLLLFVENAPDWIKFLTETSDQNQFHQCVFCGGYL